MLITPFTRNYFSPQDRDRGGDYFRQGRVSNLEVDDGILFADVMGKGQIYDVVIILDRLPSLSLECSCPQFQKTQSCKHAWATLLQIERELSNDQSDLYFSLNSIINPTSDWQTLLEKAKLANQSARPRRSSQSRPGILETAHIIYAIDVGAPHRYNDELELFVLKRKKKKNGEWGKLRQHELSYHNIDRCDDLIDQQIQAQLLGAKPSTDYYHYQYSPASFSKFDVCDRLSNGLSRYGRRKDSRTTKDQKRSGRESHPVRRIVDSDNDSR